MIVAQLMNQLDLKLLAGQEGVSKKVTGFYTGDLLSWVMIKAEKGQAWITIQTNINVIAVAVLSDISCIIVAESAAVPDDTLQKSNEKHIPVLQTPLTAYQIAVQCAGLDSFDQKLLTTNVFSASMPTDL